MTVGTNRRRGVREDAGELIERVFRRSGALPWTGTQLGNRQSRSRTVGEYDDSTYVQAWDGNAWSVVDRNPFSDPTHEGWVRDRG